MAKDACVQTAKPNALWLELKTYCLTLKLHFNVQVCKPCFSNVIRHMHAWSRLESESVPWNTVLILYSNGRPMI